MSDGVPADLGMTARWTAAVRAAESRREDRLFDDPWAAALAAEDGAAWLRGRPANTVTVMVLRTRFYDDYLRRSTWSGGIRQVVLLAAGLDTRAFRLRWPDGTVIYEVDRADVLDRKDAVLSAAGAGGAAGEGVSARRRTCATDLADSGWPGDLRKAGFDPATPAVFLAEGFLFYLPTPAVSALLGRLGDLAAAGSELGFDIVNERVLTHPVTADWVRMQAAAGAPWQGVLDDPVSTLDLLGWQARLSQCGAPDADHGRWPFPVIPLTAPDLPHHWLVTATRR